MIKPTQAIMNAEGHIEVVFPEGYDAEDLLDLPADYYTRGWYKWDNGFVDDLEGWRAQVNKSANLKRDNILYSGYDTSIGTIQTDLQSRQMLYTIKLDSMISTDENYSVDITLK